MTETRLTSIHRSLGAEIETFEGYPVPKRYGDLQQELTAVAENSGLLDLSHWAKIRITGPDRKTYLHGLTTNEVNKLSPGQGNYSLILTAQGKVLADLWVLNREEEVLLIAQAHLRQTIHGTLDKYLIMEDAAIQDVNDDFALLSLQGPQSETILRKLIGSGDVPSEDYHHAEVRWKDIPLIVLRVSHTGEDGYDMILEREHADAVWTALTEAGAKPVGMEALEILRVEAGIPICGKELDQTVIPQEAALHHALSFTKGCYVGQEVVARLHFRGHVNRELTKFVLETHEVPDEVVQLHQEEKQVGKITSAVRSPRLGSTIGLGYLRCALREPGNRITGKWGEREIITRVL